MKRQHSALAAGLLAARPELTAFATRREYQIAYGAWSDAVTEVAHALSDSERDTFDWMNFRATCGHYSSVVTVADRALKAKPAAL